MTDPLVHILRQTEESYRGIHPGVEIRLEGWEKWYAQWLLTLVELESLLGVRPTQRTLEKLLLHCNEQYADLATKQGWAEFMAKRMKEIVAKHFPDTK